MKLLICLFLLSLLFSYVVLAILHMLNFTTFLKLKKFFKNYYYAGCVCFLVKGADLGKSIECLPEVLWLQDQTSSVDLSLVFFHVNQCP